MRVSTSTRFGRIFWRQVGALTTANLKSRYRNTIAGFIWVVMNPLIMFGAQDYAFKHVLKLQIPNYSLFLVSALLPWIFISQSIEMCTSMFVVSGRLLKSFPLHPLAYLIAQLADNAINFLAAFTLLLVPIWLTSTANPVGLLLLPAAVMVLIVGVLGMTWLLATLNVFFRDTRFIVSFMLSVSFFITPIFYPVEYVPAKFKLLVTLNPFYRLILPFRIALGDFNMIEFSKACGIAAAVSTAFLGAAMLVWKRKRNAVYLNI